MNQLRTHFWWPRRPRDQPVRTVSHLFFILIFSDAAAGVQDVRQADGGSGVWLPALCERPARYSQVSAVLVVTTLVTTARRTGGTEASCATNNYYKIDTLNRGKIGGC